jgi:hypothetical protein
MHFSERSFKQNFSGSIPSWISNLSTLSVLLLKANHFHGGFPDHLCSLELLSMLYFSHNKLSGPLSSCLSNLTFMANDAKCYASFTWPSIQYFDQSNLVLMDLPQVGDSYRENKYTNNIADLSVEFSTERQSYSYRDDLLTFMSGIDFSCNGFTGKIPPNFEIASELRAVNLSHMNLIGSIPATL